MTTEKQVKENFLEDLSKLLKEYDTAIELEYDDRDIIIYIPAEFRADGKCLSEFCEVNLGSHFDGL